MTFSLLDQLLAYQEVIWFNPGSKESGLALDETGFTQKDIDAAADRSLPDIKSYSSTMGPLFVIKDGDHSIKGATYHARALNRRAVAKVTETIDARYQERKTPWPEPGPFASKTAE